MYNLKVSADLQLQHKLDNTKINKLINGCIKRNRHTTEQSIETKTDIFWTSQEHQLHKSSLFNSLATDIQRAIVIDYNQQVLSHLYFLEKSGLAYCAKMLLLGQTTEQRQLYGLIAAEEAIHLSWITPFVPESLRDKPQGKLLPTLSEIIQDCTANQLYFLVQVVLEGWGVASYRNLSQTCKCDNLRKILKNIAKDEALHHKAGIEFFDHKKITQTELKLYYDKMACYAEIFRSGPHTLIQSVEKFTGELSINKLEELFSDLDVEITSTVKLNILKSLFSIEGMQSFLHDLEMEGYFRPYSASQNAKMYQQSRNKLSFI